MSGWGETNANAWDVDPGSGANNAGGGGGGWGNVQSGGWGWGQPQPDGQAQEQADKGFSNEGFGQPHPAQKPANAYKRDQRGSNFGGLGGENSNVVTTFGRGGSTGNRGRYNSSGFRDTTNQGFRGNPQSGSGSQSPARNHQQGQQGWGKPPEPPKPTGTTNMPPPVAQQDQKNQPVTAITGTGGDTALAQNGKRFVIYGLKGTTTPLSSESLNLFINQHAQPPGSRSMHNHVEELEFKPGQDVAFVGMISSESAQRARDGLDGYSFFGKEVHAYFAPASWSGGNNSISRPATPVIQPPPPVQQAQQLGWGEKRQKENAQQPAQVTTDPWGRTTNTWGQNAQTPAGNEQTCGAEAGQNFGNRGGRGGGGGGFRGGRDGSGGRGSDNRSNFGSRPFGGGNFNGRGGGGGPPPANDQWGSTNQSTGWNVPKQNDDAPANAQSGRSNFGRGGRGGGARGGNRGGGSNGLVEVKHGQNGLFNYVGNNNRCEVQRDQDGSYVGNNSVSGRGGSGFGRGGRGGSSRGGRGGGNASGRKTPAGNDETDGSDEAQQEQGKSSTNWASTKQNTHAGQREENPPSKVICITNLNVAVKKNDLIDLMHSKKLHVTNAIVRPNQGLPPRSYLLAEFISLDESARAIQELQNIEIMGKVYSAVYSRIPSITPDADQIRQAKQHSKHGNRNSTYENEQQNATSAQAATSNATESPQPASDPSSGSGDTSPSSAPEVAQNADGEEKKQTAEQKAPEDEETATVQTGEPKLDDAEKHPEQVEEAVEKVEEPGSETAADEAAEAMSPKSQSGETEKTQSDRTIGDETVASDENTAASVEEEPGKEAAVDGKEAVLAAAEDTGNGKNDGPPKAEAGLDGKENKDPTSEQQSEEKLVADVKESSSVATSPAGSKEKQSALRHGSAESTAGFDSCHSLGDTDEQEQNAGQKEEEEPAMDAPVY